MAQRCRLPHATGHEIGLRLTPRARGAELDLYCDTSTPAGDQVLFASYVHDHLRARAGDVGRLRTYICQRCATPVENRATARKRLFVGKPDIGCADCEARVPLWDEIEQLLASDDVRQQVEAMREESRIVLDNESRERSLVGEVIATVARAGQIAREVYVSDHGIDVEVEFKNDDHQATGRKVYLQLKSGNSHLRPRTRDGTRLFRIDKVRHANYWADQAFPVMLVVGDDSGAVEWMEIRDPLRRQRERGDWPPKVITFVGQRFDTMSVRRWREAALAE